MDPFLFDAEEFLATYGELLDEIVRLAQSELESPHSWLESLLTSPLRFPPELESRPGFAKFKAKFEKLASAATGDIGALEEMARREVRNKLGGVQANGRPRMRGGPRAKPPMRGAPAPPPTPVPAADGPNGGLLSAPPPQATPRMSAATAGEDSSPPEPGADSPRPASAAPSEARFLNAGIAGHAKDQPLEVGETYVLEFGVDLEKAGDASAAVPDASFLFAENEQIIELTVQVVSDDFEVAQGPTPLKLPRTGRSKGKARFDITPIKNGAGTLTATIHKAGNFLMQMQLTYAVGEGLATPASPITHGRTINSAASLQPRELGMAIRPAPAGGYECTVWGAVHTRVTLPITEAELGDAIRGARDALMAVVTQRDSNSGLVFQTGLDIDAASQQQALTTLARAGATLFQRIFFGPASGADVQGVGNFLRKRATQPGELLKLQIVAERFPIPWGMLYVGKVAGGAPLDWDLFLGMRHIIEQIPLQTQLRVEDTVIKSDDPALSVSVNVNTGIDKQMKTDVGARQREFWKRNAEALGAKLQFVERLSRADLLQALGSAGDQLMYLYCHAITSNPGDAGGINASCLVLSGDERLTLGDLNLEAPMTETFRGSPLIFINACESAELTPAFYDGFVPYFMAKGARGVVGPECKTPARFATEWALRFFPRFLAGEPLGQLFLDLRREFSEDHHNPLGLLYAVHCDADTQVQPGLTI